MPEIPTVQQRLSHVRTLVDAMQSVAAHHSLIPHSGPIIWAEVADTLANVQYDLSSLARAMDANVFCRACRDSFAPDEIGGAR